MQIFTSVLMLLMSHSAQTCEIKEFMETPINEFWNPSNEICYARSLLDLTLALPLQ